VVLPEEVETEAARTLEFFWVGSMTSISKLVGSEETEVHVMVSGLLGSMVVPDAGEVMVSAKADAKQEKTTKRAEACIFAI